MVRVRPSVRLSLLLAALAVLILAALIFLLSIGGPVQGSPQASALSKNCSKVAESTTYMRQTVRGYTVTLHPVYADASRVVVTYTVAVEQNSPAIATPFHTDIGGPTSQKEYAARLNDSSGREFPILGRPAGWTANGQIIRASHESGWEALAFDTSSLLSLPSSLDLDLALDSAIFREPSSFGGITSLGVDGPYNFHFTIPVDPTSRVAEVHKTLQTKLGTYNLERVVATCHATRVFLHFDKAEGYTPYDSYLTLEANGYSPPRDMWLVGATHVYSSDINFLDTSLLFALGIWKVNLWSMYTGNAAIPNEVVGTFSFVMPPLESVQP